MERMWKDGPAQQEAELWAREVCRDTVQLGSLHRGPGQAWMDPRGWAGPTTGEYWRNLEIFLRHFTLDEATGPGLPKPQWLMHCFVPHKAPRRTRSVVNKSKRSGCAAWCYVCLRSASRCSGPRISAGESCSPSTFHHHCHPRSCGCQVSSRIWLKASTSKTCCPTITADLLFPT